MPTDTWPAPRDMMSGGVSLRAPLASAMPFRILNKGPEYFRRQAATSARKPSAVERLEADKAKYVKSKQVASTRQEPVQPLLLKQPLFSPGVRRVLLTTNRKASPGGRRRDACGPKSALNLDILSSLISLCDSPAPRAEASPLERRGKRAPAEGPGRQCEGSAASRSSSTVAVRRVDVLPSAAQRPRPCPALRITPAPASPARSRVSSSSSLASPQSWRTDSAKKPALLQRSKSDLSDRYSRASADLERFFNYCGLDPHEAPHLGVERLARASSDIVSAQLRSVSAASSECSPSRRSAATAEEPPGDRMPYGISVIERNARVIKWLYGLRQAREPPRVSKV